MMMTSLTLGSTTLYWGRQTYVMGIINATPDSFSGDGLLQDEAWLERAVAQGRRFAAEGAHILDVGGESTRPGATPVDADQERQRVVPVIQALAQEVDLPISIDTTKASVAEAALDAGACLVNDVWGLRLDPDLGALCARRGAPVIVMHNRSTPKHVVRETQLGGYYVGTHYDDLLSDVRTELQASIDLARAAGIPDEHIIIDPGIGFGKTVEQNLILINRLDFFKTLGYPILLGPSNKSFIGKTLDLPPAERLEGTAAAVAVAIDRGVDIIRVHQVKEMARLARMVDAIVRSGVTPT
jgi:dihydropteroate synthase